MSRPRFSVVIPTRDRASVLARTLAALEAQQDAPTFEIVIVDDGSTDGTAEMLDRFPFERRRRVIGQSPRGPAAARNAGVEASTGEWIAFLGSDTLPSPDWLAMHWRRHRRCPDGGVAVIGRIDWHPRVRRTRFLGYINEWGLQFGYALIRDPTDVPFNFFYGSNLSLHRRWLEEHRFDSRFSDAAWEDIELGYRLTRAGLRLAYVAEALVLHDHPTDIESFLRRQRRVGRSAVLFRELHRPLCHFLRLPPTGPPRLPSARLVAMLQRLATAVEGWPLALPWLWRYLAAAHYLRGCADACQAPPSAFTTA